MGGVRAPVGGILTDPGPSTTERRACVVFRRGSVVTRPALQLLFPKNQKDSQFVQFGENAPARRKGGHEAGGAATHDGHAPTGAGAGLDEQDGGGVGGVRGTSAASATAVSRSPVKVKPLQRGVFDEMSDAEDDDVVGPSARANANRCVAAPRPPTTRGRPRAHRAERVFFGSVGGGGGGGAGAAIRVEFRVELPRDRRLHALVLYLQEKGHAADVVWLRQALEELALPAARDLASDWEAALGERDGDDAAAPAGVTANGGAAADAGPDAAGQGGTSVPCFSGSASQGQALTNALLPLARGKRMPSPLVHRSGADRGRALGSAQPSVLPLAAHVVGL